MEMNEINKKIVNIFTKREIIEKLDAELSGCKSQIRGYKSLLNTIASNNPEAVTMISGDVLDKTIKLKSPVLILNMENSRVTNSIFEFEKNPDMDYVVCFMDSKNSVFNENTFC